MIVRRVAQLTSLGLFLTLLGLAAAASAPDWAVDLFQRMDPSLAALTMLASQKWIWALWPAAVVLASGLLFGRAFCGYVCPMGTTIDGADKMIGRGKTKPARWLRGMGWLVLAFLGGAALAGVSLVFLAAPLSLVTRLYGLVALPATELLGGAAVDIVRPVADDLGLNWLAFWQISAPRFDTVWFIVGMFAVIFGLARLAPRFWCRYLCPSGAMLALFAAKPLIRRRVAADSCTACGKCRRACPMAAIEQNPLLTNHRDCLLCRTCASVCPEKAISFLPGPIALPANAAAFSPTRRQLLLSGVGGASTAMLAYGGLQLPRAANDKTALPTPMLLRPPGALPEHDLLKLCVRCGLCMAACPTNTLQPIWFEAGLTAAFSPTITPRLAPCDPRCTACGQSCPTGAIRPLTSDERVWAKTGTAIVDRQRCLAWNQHKKCVVCDEVCPYDAISLVQQPGIPVSVPLVDADKCGGCGFCEKFCPVRNKAAIVVNPLGELRLDHGSYAQNGVMRGLNLHLVPPGGQSHGHVSPTNGPAPGFTD